jgi:hypothetical protein
VKAFHIKICVVNPLRPAVRAQSRHGWGYSRASTILPEQRLAATQSVELAHVVNYLEIYEPDVLEDEMQPVLRYGAALFAQ